MPPLQALAALHGFWIMIFLPPVLWAIQLCSPSALRRLGSGLISLGVLGIGGIIGHSLLVWLPQTPGGQAYLPQRILFVLVTLGDVPIVPLTLAGTACLFAARRKKRIRVDQPEA